MRIYLISLFLVGCVSASRMDRLEEKAERVVEAHEEASEVIMGMEDDFREVMAGFNDVMKRLRLLLPEPRE